MSVNAADKSFLLMKTGGRCAHCGKALADYEATVEHIFPKSKGGADDEWNLTVLCPTCNMEKSNYVYDMYYYQYILREFRPNYRRYHDSHISRLRQGRILLHEPQRICFLTLSAKMMLSKYTKHKKLIPRALMQRMTSWVSVYPAYPGDADEVFELVDKCVKNKDFKCSSSYYDNDMMVLNEIKEGKVFVMRSKDNELCGAVFLKKYSDFDADYPQVRNISENMGLAAKYVITGFYCTRTYDEALIDLMKYLETRLLVIGIMPIFFEGCECIRRHDDEMAFPVTIDGYSGTLYVPTVKSLRNNLAAEMENTIFAKSDYDWEDIVRFAEIWLKDRDDLTDEDREFVKDYPDMEAELSKAKHDFREEHGLAYALNS